MRALLIRSLLQEVLDDVYLHAKQEGVDLQVEIAGAASSQGRDAGERLSNRGGDGSISEEEVAAVLVLGVIASTAALDKISCRSLPGTSPASSAPLAPMSEQAGSNDASSPLHASVPCPTASLGSTSHGIQQLQEVRFGREMWYTYA